MLLLFAIDDYSVSISGEKWERSSGGAMSAAQQEGADRRRVQTSRRCVSITRRYRNTKSKWITER